MKYFSLAIAFLLITTFSSSQDYEVLNYFPEVLDGTVHVVKVDQENERVYVGGNFSEIQYPQDFCYLGLSGNTPSFVNEDLPKLDGPVRAIVEDGQGGYFIGGDFSTADEFKRTSLVHVNSDFQIKALNIDIAGAVRSLAYDIEKELLYIGGQFSSIEGEERTNLAAVSTDLFKISPWNPTVNGIVYDIELKGDTVFVGGSFNGIGEIQKLAVLYNPTTGELGESDLGPNTTITAAIPDGNGGWYISGKFSSIEGVPRDGFAQIDSAGNLTDWTASAQSPGVAVNSMLLRGDDIFVGGWFTSINGEPRSNLAKLDAETGELDPWAPDPDGLIYQIGTYNDSLLVAGDFENINNTVRSNLALLDPDDAGVSSFAFDLNSYVRQFEVNGDFLHLAGNFSMIDSIESNTFVTIDLSDSSIIPVAANSTLTGELFDFEIKGDTAFIGGVFSDVSGDFQLKNLAALNWTTGELFDWSVQVNDWITHMEMIDQKLFIGGRFLLADGHFRTQFAAFDTETLNITDDALAFSQIGFEPAFFSVMEKQDGKLLLGSYLGNVQENLRFNLAAFDGAGELLDFDIPLSSGHFGDGDADFVYDLLEFNDKLYAAGDFGNNQIVQSQFLASMNLNTGTPDSLSFEIDDRVMSLEVKENLLYFGGSFSEIDGMQQRLIARMNTDDNSIDDWQLPINGEDIFALQFNNDELAFGGRFTFQAGGDFLANFAAFDLNTLTLSPNIPKPNDAVRTIITLDEGFLIGGEMEFAESMTAPVEAKNLFAVDVNTGELIDLPISSPDSTVFDILVAGDDVYLAGRFGIIDGQTRSGLAKLNRDDLSLSQWGSDLQLANSAFRTVRDISLDNNRLYYAGRVSYEGDPAPGFGAIDANSGQVINWPANNSYTLEQGSFRVIYPSDTSVFVGGAFELKGPNDGSGVTEGFRDIVEIGKSSGISTSFKPEEIQGEIINITDIIKYEGDIPGLQNNLIVTGTMNVLCAEMVGRIDLDDEGFYSLGAEIVTAPNDFFCISSPRNQGQEVLLSDGNLYLASASFLGEFELDGSMSFGSYTNIYSDDTWYEDGFGVAGPQWEPKYIARSIDVADNTLFAGGDFLNIQGEPRQRFAAVQKSTCEIPNPGTVSTESPNLNLCLNNDASDLLQAEVTGNTGENSAFVLHDEDLNIVKAKFNGLFNLDGIAPGEYFVSHVAYSSIDDTSIDNLNDLSGCFAISNSFPVTTFKALAGTISTSDPLNYCTDDLPASISFTQSGNSGPNQGFVRLNSSNQIQEVNTDGTFDLTGLTPDTYKVAAVSTDENIDIESVDPTNLPDCFNYSNLINFTISACGQANLESSPNPVIDVSTVTFFIAEPSNVQLEVFDLTGKRIALIYTGAVEAQTSMNFQFDTSDLPSGVYIYKLTGEHGVKSIKFLKSN